MAIYLGHLDDEMSRQYVLIPSKFEHRILTRDVTRNNGQTETSVSKVSTHLPVSIEDEQSPVP